MPPRSHYLDNACGLVNTQGTGIGHALSGQRQPVTVSLVLLSVLQWELHAT